MYLVQNLPVEFTTGILDDVLAMQKVDWIMEVVELNGLILKLGL